MPYRLATLAREAGFKGLFAGLGPRMVMTAGMISSQFLMYGYVKRGEIFLFTVVIYSLTISKPLVPLLA